MTDVQAVNPSKFKPTRYWNLLYPCQQLVDRKPGEDPASSKTLRFVDSNLLAMTAEDAEMIERIGGPNVVKEDLPEGSELECETCHRTTRSSKWFARHLQRHNI